MFAHADDPPSIAELCRHVGVSRRTLQGCFQDALGLTPLQYLRMLRLNAVRRELRALAAARQPVSIGDVAARWGFWHWSRFTENYRQLFGELPSHTVRRVRSASVSISHQRLRVCQIRITPVSGPFQDFARNCCAAHDRSSDQGRDRRSDNGAGGYMTINGRIAAAALVAVSAGANSANAFEFGSAGFAQKPGIALGGGTAGAPPPGLYSFNQVFTYQSKLVGPGAPNVGGAATPVHTATEASGLLWVPGWTFLGATYDAVIVQPSRS